MQKPSDDENTFNQIMQDFSINDPNLLDRLRREDNREADAKRGVINIKDYDMLIALPHRDEIDNYHAWSVKTVFDKEDTIRLLESIVQFLRER